MRWAPALLAALWASPVWAAGGAGEWMTAFSANARAAGLSDASAALPGTGAVLNPAGVLTPSGELSVMLTPLFSGGQFQSLAAAQPLSPMDSVGLTVLHLASGEAESTDFMGQTVGSFSERNMAFLFSYGRRLGGRMDVGLGFKVLTQSLAGFSATGTGLDAGVRFRPFRRLSVGAALQNAVRPALRLRDVAERPAAALRLGSAVEFAVKGRRCLWTFDLLRTGAGRSREDSQRTGLEAEVVRGEAFPLTLRLGADRREFTAGWGLGRGAFQFDYAVAFQGLGLQHRVGLAMRYGVLSPFAERRLQEEKDQLSSRAEALEAMKREIEEERAARARETEAALLLQEARAFFREERWEDGRERLRRALELAPRDPSALELKGELDRKDAADAARRHLALGRELRAAAKWDEALRALDKALAFGKDDGGLRAEVHMERAEIFLHQKEYVAAERTLRHALKLDPANREAASMYERLRDVLEAYETAQKR